MPPSQADAWAEAQLGERLDEFATPEAEARYSTFWAWIDGRQPADPVWHLDSVGVDPAARGRGIGGALITHGLEMARTEGVGAALETGNPGNIALYQRYGFRVVEVAGARDGGPTVWFMRWEP